MPDARQRFGKEGESFAERFLRSRGYHIIARNVRSASGELDLIADDGSGEGAEGAADCGTARRMTRRMTDQSACASA